MPYPNEHAARLHDPGKYSGFRRENNAGGAGVDFIYGLFEDGGETKSEIQAIRFDASKFTAEEAKAWCSKHGHKCISFEPASGKENEESRFRKVPVTAGRFSMGSGAVVADPKTDRFTLTPFAGQVFDHWFWGKMTFDASGLSMRKSVIPAFKDHDPTKLVGEIDALEVKDGKVVLSGEFAKTASAEEIRSVKKLEWECSLAFDLGSAVIEEIGPEMMAKVNGAELAGPATVVRKAVLYETSFTFFGAVPGTATAFTETDATKCVSVPIFYQKEVPMSNLDKVQEDAKAAALGLFQKMSAMSEDKAFVAECFGKGMDIAQFQEALLKKQSEQVAQLKADLEAAKKAPVSGAAPATFSAPAAAPSHARELTFIEVAHKLASDAKISVSAAFSRVARENPELYKKHLEAAPVSKR